MAEGLVEPIVYDDEDYDPLAFMNLSLKELNEMQANINFIKEELMKDCLLFLRSDIIQFCHLYRYYNTLQRLGFRFVAISIPVGIQRFVKFLTDCNNNVVMLQEVVDCAENWRIKDVLTRLKSKSDTDIKISAFVERKVQAFCSCIVQQEKKELISRVESCDILRIVTYYFIVNFLKDTKQKRDVGFTEMLVVHCIALIRLKGYSEQPVIDLNVSCYQLQDLIQRCIGLLAKSFEL